MQDDACLANSPDMVYCIMQEVAIDIRGEELILDAQKTLFWPKMKGLLIADLHIGKINHFRKFGIPLPIEAISKNFEMLQEQIEKYSPEVVYFLGDLFHSRYNAEWDLLNNEMTKYSDINWVLIMGNHDILPPQVYENSPLTIVDSQLTLGPFMLTHHPMESIPAGAYNLCGHIHPGVRIHGKGRQSLRLPCFYFNNSQGILPAFGTFTGTSVIEISETAVIYGIAENTIIRIE